MRNTLFLFLAQTRLFWQVRRAFSRLAFINYRMLFGIKSRIREESATTKSLLSLLGLIRGQLVVVIIVAIVLQITNLYFVSLFTGIGFTIPKESYYGTLLTAFTSIGGIFIGFYYAAISVVCSAIYAKVPNNIRDLLAQERVGNAYMRLLALLTFFGVCLLAFHIVGLEPVILAMPLLILGAGLMIIGFVQLGTRVFHLFDPTILSGTIFEQLRQCCAQMQAGGYRWSDQSFQKHSHRVAQTTIDTLNTLSDITAKEPHLNGRPFAGLCQNLLLFLRHYETVKKSIPTGSLWYRQRYVHPDWYRTGDTETSLAHETAAILRPESVSDPRWIESAILPIVKGCLEINIRNKRYALVNEFLGYLDAYVQHLAKEQQVESAFNLMREIFSWCERLILRTEDQALVEEPAEHMQICEKLTTMPINALLAYAGAIKSYDRNAILQRIRHIRWKSEKSIYRAGFSMHLLTQLEWLRPRLEFEEGVEQYIVSPPWYLGELIAQKEVENLRTAMIYFYAKVGKFYKHWIETALSSQHPWLAAVMMLRESEYWNKLDSHTNTLNQLWNDLNSDRRIEGLLWSSLNTDELAKKRYQREKVLLKLMADENVLLSLIPRAEAHPDFAGQFLHTVGEALLDALCENDYDTVDMLFKGYFCGNQLKCEQLRPQENMPSWQLASNVKTAVAPLLDLMDLSGYAYLLSDYYNTQRLKETVAKVWDEYLDQDSAQSRLQFLAGAVSLTESAYEIAHRSRNRSGWKQTIRQQLRDLERQEVPEDLENQAALRGQGFVFVESETIVLHESPLVRIFADDHSFLLYDGIDIFLAKYIRQREDGRDLDFGRPEYRDIEEAIRREESRNMMDEHYEK